MSDAPQLRVSDYMTPLPVTVEVGMRLSDTLDRMYSDNIRHLPVVDTEGKLVGMISTRDIAAVAALRGVNPMKATVETAMAAVPYACPEDCSLIEVVTNMENDRLGSAVVTNSTGKPVGIFTTTDALRVLRGQLTGQDVKPLVHPEVTPGEGDTERKPMRPRRGGSTRASDSMVSWFLAKF